MSERLRLWSAAALVVSAWIGALAARPSVAPLVACASAAVVLARRNSVVADRDGRASRSGRLGVVVLACLAVAGATSSHASRQQSSIVPVGPGRVDGQMVVTEDPEWFGGSVRVVVSHAGVELEGWARGSAGVRLAERQVGESVQLSGAVTPMRASWRLHQGVVGRLTVEHVGDWAYGGPLSRLANGLRRTLADGARSMDDVDAGLYLGLVLGDRRGQDALTEDAFSGSGLTHLLAVSGSNVAFVVVLAGPFLRRLRLVGRLMGILAVVGFFAVVTRMEPSVLRAATMTGIGAAAVTFGREAESRMILASAVVVLLLVDPSLARALGFQLSVAASLGILLLANPLGRRLPGPRLVAEALAVTIAAQLAVAPLLIPIAGGLPVASLPANLLAVPVTGPVLVWGIPAGVLAGLLGGDSLPARWLHAPTSVMVSWIDGVARVAAESTLGELGQVHLVVLAAAVLVVVACSRSGARRLAGLVAVIVVVQPAIALAVGGAATADLGSGAWLHRNGAAIVLELDGTARAVDVLAGLRRAGVRRVDVVVARSGGSRVAEVVALLERRVGPRLVLAPRGHRVPGASVPPVGSVVTVGQMSVEVVAVSPDLSVDVGVRVRPGRAPPDR